jgi:DNA-binding NarL/FixJ family response regulator
MISGKNVMQNDTIRGQRSTSFAGVAAGNGRSNHHPNPKAENGKSEGDRPMQPLIKTKVLVVHGVPLIRFGLVRLIASSQRFAVCADTDNVPTARELFALHQPKLAVLGLTLRGGDGIELIKDFRKLNLLAGTLVLSAREDALSMQRAFRAGARGYLVTGDDIPEFLTALDQISAGNLYASTSVSRRLLENLMNGAIESATCELKTLSDREMQVFSLIGRGFGATRLANELHLSVKTIETYQMHIKEKLGLRSATELSEKATRAMLHSVRHNLQLRKDASLKNGSAPGTTSHVR